MCIENHILLAILPEVVSSYAWVVWRLHPVPYWLHSMSHRVLFLHIRLCVGVAKREIWHFLTNMSRNCSCNLTWLDDQSISNIYTSFNFILDLHRCLLPAAQNLSYFKSTTWLPRLTHIDFARLRTNSWHVFIIITKYASYFQVTNTHPCSQGWWMQGN